MEFSSFEEIEIEEVKSSQRSRWPAVKKIDFIESREELEDLKIEVDRRSAELKAELLEIKGSAKAYGVYSTPEEYAQKMKLKGYLGFLSQKIQSKLGRIRIEKPVPFPAFFMTAAQELLTEKDFNEIIDLAKQKMELKSKVLEWKEL